MVRFESALKKAKKLKPNIDSCREFTDAYVFASQEDEYSCGGDGPVVVLKDSGKAINMVDYTQTSSDAELIREFEL